MIKNVVFDLGRVIYSYSPYEYLLSLGYEGQQAEQLMECTFGSSLWLDIDRGIYSISEATDIMCGMFPAQEVDIRRVLEDSWMDKVLTKMHSSIEFYFEVKRRGYGTYILSNIASDTFAYLRKRDAFLFDEADGVVVSAHEKCIKPEAAIFNNLLVRYSLTPCETLFIDDDERNIAAAKKLGINGIVFTDIEDCKQQYELLVN